MEDLGSQKHGDLVDAAGRYGHLTEELEVGLSAFGMRLGDRRKRDNRLIESGGGGVEGTNG
jgi:hypothetical protein